VADERLSVLPLRFPPLVSAAIKAVIWLGMKL